MSTPAAGFDPVAEVAADDGARIAFGRAGVRRNDRFLISTRSTGESCSPLWRASRSGSCWCGRTTCYERRCYVALADASQGRVSEQDDLLDDNAGL